MAQKSEAVVAFDCCFHPDALNMGSRYKAFRDLLVSTAIQGIEEACRLQNQSTTVNKEFSILKGVTYKSGEVPTMMIDLNSKENKWNADMMAKQNNDSSVKVPEKEVIADPEPEKEKSAMDMVTALEEASDTPKPKKKPAVKKGFLNNPKTAGSLYPAGSNEGKRGVVPTKPLVEELPEGYVSKAPASVPTASTKTKELTDPPLLTPREVKRKSKAANEEPVEDGKTPKFTLIERGILGLGDFDGGNTSHKRKPTSNRPEELVYKIEIPLVKKTSKVELDVGEKELKMTYLDVYDLCINLPYKVYDKKGGAKFDKVKKLLTITLPVQPFQLDDEPDDMAIEETTDAVEMVREVSNTESNESSKPSSLKKESNNAHERWLSREGGDGKDKDTVADVEPPRVEELTADENGGERKETLSEEIARKAKEAVREAERLKKEEDKKKPKAKPSVVKSPADKSELKKKSEDSSDSSVVDADYIPSGTYVGSKQGYVFKKGENGMGYYKDTGGKLVKKGMKTPIPTSSVDSLDSVNLQNSTLNSVTTDKENQSGNTKAVIDTVWKEFPFQFRQTKEGVAMIIDVKNIIEESVNIHFDAKHFDVSFASTKSTSSSSVDATTVDYGLSFDCLKEVDAKSCKFDVATHNMVIVLQKKVEEFWVSEVPANGEKSEVISPREYAGADTANHLQFESASVPMTNSKDDAMSSTKFDAISLLEDMKFGSAGLMELD